MSIYTNPVYNNPTTIPYTKLKDESTMGPLFVASKTNIQKLYRTKHRIASAVSCLLCTLTIILMLLFGTLVLSSLFGRCFRSEREESEGFERFMRMFQSKELEADDDPAVIPVRGPYRQRIFPFPLGPNQMPGPVIPPSDLKERLKHAQCPVMNLLECNRDTFDGYSMKEHQQKTDLSLGKAILSGRLNTSTVVNKARTAFRECVKFYDGEKQPIMRRFARKLWKIKELSRGHTDSAKSFATISAHGRSEFGADSFFRVHVEANYLAPDGDHPYLLYLEQHLPAPTNAGLLSLMRRAFPQQLNESQYQHIYLNVPRIREMVDTADSMQWKTFTAAEAQTRWPFFDFAEYLRLLNEAEHEGPVHFTNNLEKFVFVVKTPAFFDKLNAFFMARSEQEKLEKEELFKLMSIYNIFAAFDKYFGIGKMEDEMRKKYQIGNPPTSNSQSYHFIYTYSDGQASYEALRFCAQDLREHLPHVASALHSAMTTDFPIHEEIQRFEGLVELTREELLEWVARSGINSTHREVLEEKLRKIGISFTTRESLEKDLFERAHEKLQLDHTDYLRNAVEMKSFLFNRKLDRLTSKIEALRSSAFAESSAATAEIKYSRLGNWLNVPAAILTSPILGPSADSWRTLTYSNLVWMLGREMMKAVDSEGIMYNALGVHKLADPSLVEMERIWTDAQSCLQSQLHNMDLVGVSKSTLVRETLNEILGFQIAYKSFVKAFDKVIGTQTSSRRPKSDLRSSALKNFFQTSASVYCELGERGASVTLTDKAVDSFVKQHDILGCSQGYDNLNCAMELTRQ